MATAILEVWSAPLLENLWTLIPISVTFLMVHRAGTTAMDWVSHCTNSGFSHTKLPLLVLSFSISVSEMALE